jgi:hypothetical protein
VENNLRVVADLRRKTEGRVERSFQNIQEKARE